MIRVGGKFFRRLSKALASKPFVAHSEDDNNEDGRFIVRRHGFRGSSNDLCQVLLRCNVDLQYQVRTLPEQQQDDAAEHATAPKCNKNGILPRLLCRLSKKSRRGQSFAGQRSHFNTILTCLRPVYYQIHGRLKPFWLKMPFHSSRDVAGPSACPPISLEPWLLCRTWSRCRRHLPRAPRLLNVAGGLR